MVRAGRTALRMVRRVYDAAMTEIAPGLRVEGPVRVEVFVVWLAGDQLELTGPCGWETIGTEDEVVAATGEHGRSLHNMDATRDEILALAIPATDARPELDAAV